MKKAEIIKQKIKQLMLQSSLGRSFLVKRNINRLYATALPQNVVEDAEKGVQSKEEFVKYCAQKWPKLVCLYHEKIDTLFASVLFLQEMDEDQKAKIRTDIIFCRFAYGFITDEYVTYRLDLKNMEERRSFISEREHMLYYYKMNDLFKADTFNDKMKTYSFFKEYYGREAVAIEKKSDFHKFSEFVKNHPVFVKKEVYESCGKSIEKIDITTCGKTERELFEDFISRGKTVLEECIAQHPATGIFNASSVNTVRVITFNTKHGYDASFTFMKIGRAGAFVDNGGAGGILVGIDAKTGVLNTRGIDEMHNEYEVHPDSGVEFAGHQLPDWDKAIAMCKEMAALMPDVRYIGWDLAYTADNEWVVVEGNGMSQFIGPQAIWQRGIKDEVIAYMEDMDINISKAFSAN